MTNYESFKFFREHAGYSVPPGRAACALELARAEEMLRDAEELDIASVEWLDDDIPYDIDMDADEVARLFATGEWTGPFGCVLTVEGEVVSSLWGIVVGSAATDDPYCRVVEAELASEQLNDLRQAIGDMRDSLAIV